MPPARKGKKTMGRKVAESRVQSAAPDGMPLWKPPELRLGKVPGVFVETVDDDDLIRQAHADMRKVPWDKLDLKDSPALQRAFLMYHCVNVLPITMQALEQGAYQQEYMQQVASYMSSKDLLCSEESPDISVLQKKVAKVFGELTKLRNDLSHYQELIQTTIPCEMRVRAAQTVAASIRRPARSSSPAVSVRSGVSGTSVRSKAADMSDDELRAEVDRIYTASKERAPK